MKLFAFCVTGAMLLTLCSCGRKSGVYPVSGKVTHNGSPATGATVTFHRQSGDAANDPLIAGIVQEDGTFELVCGSSGKGAPAGDYDVLIEWRHASHEANGRSRSVGPDRFNGRYADPQHAVLHATVEAQANELPPFDLTN